MQYFRALLDFKPFNEFSIEAAMPVLTPKRVAFIFGFAVAATIVIVGCIQRDIFVALVGMCVGAAGLGLLGIGIYRRAGYLIVLANQGSAHAGVKFDSMLKNLGALDKQVRSAEAGELRSLVLNSFRETASRCDEIVEKSSHILEQQRHAMNGHEYLKNAINVLGNRLDRELDVLKKSIGDTAQETSGQLETLRSELSKAGEHASGELEALKKDFERARYETRNEIDTAGQEARRELEGLRLQMATGGKLASREMARVKQAMVSVRDVMEQASIRVSDNAVISEELKSIIAAERGSLIKELARPFDRVEKDIANLRYSVVNDSSSLSALLQRCPPRAIAPEFSGWALEPTSIAKLVDLVLQRQPRLVVECGSGVSTVWLAYALEKTGGKLIALEHLEKFAEVTRAELEQHGLTHVAEVRSAELEDFDIAGDTYKWYASDGWAGLKDVDLLLVDGPPKATGSFARYPAVPLLRSSFAAKMLVVLDDVHREEEREILTRWQEEFPLSHTEQSIGPRTVAIEWQATDP